MERERGRGERKGGRKEGREKGREGERKGGREGGGERKGGRKEGREITAVFILLLHHCAENERERGGGWAGEGKYSCVYLFY